jgi:hypothetical protein
MATACALRPQLRLVSARFLLLEAFPPAFARARSPHALRLPTLCAASSDRAVRALRRA